MTFNPDIPQSTDDISQSQGEILTNFDQLNKIFGSNAGALQVGDHIAFNDATTANRGKHAKARLIEQAADPATAANERALYTKDVGGATELFTRDEASGTPRQMTNLPRISPGNTGTAGGTLTYIDTPFYIRMIWGLTNPFSGNRTVITPAGSGSILTYTAIANNASTTVPSVNVTGAIVTTAGPPDTLTIYTNASMSVRWTIWTVIS
jgi:hypothetical protein